ncbi:hypothetical protein M0638_09260 [Roseomonas sp. NAR14]|uniref:Uncharacterized protein n=1 Tax=Roseomonas acroporae TaxID=2937791 RepID=A0A9X1Y7I9_9PROT|nr:hypothetical protein [Roseomonas acroporae]MCK8784568.1 hypothetical protein [Roseomonas acroporae]
MRRPRPIFRSPSAPRRALAGVPAPAFPPAFPLALLRTFLGIFLGIFLWALLACPGTARAQAVIEDPLVNGLPVDRCGDRNGHADCTPAGEALAADRVCNYYRYAGSAAAPRTAPYGGPLYRWSGVFAPDGREIWGAFAQRHGGSRIDAVACR